MVKARRGLLLSLLTLLVAIVVTTTSTYAWFAMNTSVQATNMQIKVTSDNTYLVIAKSNELVENKISGTSSQTSIDLTAANVATILPTRVKPTGNTLVWQTAAGTGYNDGTAVEYTDITSNENKYVAKFTFYVGLNPSVSVADATNLKVTGITLASTIANDAIFYDALSVCVVCGSNIDNYADAGHNATAGALAGSNTVLASTINHNGTPVQVDVYVYINGDNANVKTSNAIAANLGTYTVGVSFGVTPGTAA